MKFEACLSDVNNSPVIKLCISIVKLSRPDLFKAQVVSLGLPEQLSIEPSTILLKGSGK